MRRVVLAASVVTIAVLGSARISRAQETPEDRSFAVQLFEPAPGPDNFLTVEGTRIGSDFSMTAGAMFNYQYRPLALFDCEPGTGAEGEPECQLEDDPRAILVRHQIGADLLFSIGLFKLFTAGIALPITLYQTGDEIDYATGLPTGGDLADTFGVGDLRLHLKFRLWPFMEGDKEGFGIAFSPIVSFPIGSQFGGFLGDGNVTFTARLAADYYLPPFHAAAQVGYHWREDSVLYSTEMGQELVFGGAFAWWILDDLSVMIETFGRNGFTTEIDQTPLEIDGALRYRAGPVVLTAGGGSSILRAVGAPVARAFLGASYQPFEAPEPEDPDLDDDGFPNEVDGCPEQAEDFDEFRDEDGCPDPDNDEDGVLDAFDACPDVAEDVDDFKDDDGCPDLDHDEDGIDAPPDGCPDVAEDFDGFEDEDGCPDLDNDYDALPDASDICPNEPEDLDDFEDDDGCPEPDNDKDGVPDGADRCPEEPETLNGVDDDDGCPDSGSALVVITESQIEIKQQINFASDSDRIVGRTSFQIMDVVAAVLRANSSLRIEVQGHTDSQGSIEHNTDLSQRRAEAVRDYLVGAGIDAGRLEARGYGPEVPIADNRTRSGRAKNRRVEFHILGPGGADEGESMPAPPPPPAGDVMTIE